MFYVIFSIALFLLVIIIGACNVLIKDKQTKEKINKVVIKVFTLSFLILTFLNLFLPDGFTISLSNDEALAANGEFQAILRWMNALSFMVIPISVYKDNDYFNKIAIYFCLPVAIVNVIYYTNYLEFFTSTSGRGLYTIRFVTGAFKEFLIDETFRSIWFGAICLTQLGSLLLIAYRSYKCVFFNNAKQVGNFFLILLGLILLALPIYTPQYLIGYTNHILDRFTYVHILWIISVIAIILILYLIFKDKSYEDKYLLVIAMSLSLLHQFSMMYNVSAELTCFKFPLQLCNLASYLMLFTLLTKNNKLFNFTLIINVVGAVIAMVVLDVDGNGVGYLWNVHYIVEHSNVIIIPLVCLVLKIFDPLTKKAVKDVIIGFSIYFVSVFAIGTIFNGIYNYTGNDYFKCNFLFMFIQEDSAEILAFVGPIFDIKIKLGIFTIYPILQGLVYVVFTAICVGTFFVIYSLTHLKVTNNNKNVIKHKHI